MTHKVLIDYNALGWAKVNTEHISKDYAEILKVGTIPAPPQGSSDIVIGNFCEEENCNLITSDYKMYVNLLEIHHIKTVQIAKYYYDKEAKRHIYLIKIL